MNKIALATSRLAGQAALKMKQTSPTVLFAVGIVGVVGGAVLASHATLKLEGVLKEAQSDLGDINTLEHEEYSEQDKIQDKAIVYTRLVVNVTKLYAPAIIVGGIGIACLTGSHRILTKRNAALTAAYAALEKTYKAYRQRIKDEIGDDRERQLHYEVQKKLVNDEKERFENLKKPKSFKPGYSVYAKFFDEANKNWARNPEHNLFFIRRQEQWANDRLHIRGHLFLNEVYDMLGFPRTTAGQIVGWRAEGEGDRVVDFGIYNHHTDEVRAFVNGVENSILLDFNVDGVIYDKIEG